MKNYLHFTRKKSADLYPLLLLLAGLIWAFAACGPQSASEAASHSLTLAPGFEAEHLYSPTGDTLGSWVSLTTDGKGRLLASDQYGFLYRISPPPIGQKGKTEVEKMPVQIGHAQGLLWAFNSLYVNVNAREGVEGRASGFYRVTDSDGDDKLDQVQLLQAFEGDGEHGPHAVLLGPDGHSLYLICGNHTLAPENFSSRNPHIRNEDNLFPTIKDPGGHAQGIKAPGGWIARTDSVGSFFEIVASGFRNTYDMGFNAAGELFAWDSDMEWDMGMPWYRPIRVLHATSGAEFGWRTGSGKWPAYYPDNLPEVVNIGQGSPTGVVMGTGAKFPARYQQGMFIFDWSFGTMYFIELAESGSSYTGKKEEFLSGVPLPLADGVIGPDGAMYFVAGGRRVDSDLYRVYYTGTESTDPVTPTSSSDAQALRTLRHSLEAFHTGPDPKAVQSSWDHLGHADRHIRYAARIAIENQPLAQWESRVWSETRPVHLTQAAIALARTGEARIQNRLLDQLASVDIAALGESQQLDLIRAYGLICIHMGNPSPAKAVEMRRKLNPLFPASSAALNRELSQLLSYLQEPDVVPKTLALMKASGGKADSPSEVIPTSVISRSEQYGPTIAEMLKNMPPAQEIAYTRFLSFAKEGWTPELREQYFRWFYDAINRSGGVSYRGFIESIRNQALSNVPAAESERLAEALGEALLSAPKGIDLTKLPQPEGPGKDWQVSEVSNITQDKNMVNLSFERGKNMYDAALCSACHSIRGQGGNTGPDLTQAGTRFNRGDLARAVVNPSLVVSDQYEATRFTLSDGSIVVGRVMNETDEQYEVNQNPFSLADPRKIPKQSVTAKEASAISLMPGGLFNRLNEGEVRDLMAYIMAGGDPEHELYKK